MSTELDDQEPSTLRHQVAARTTLQFLRQLRSLGSPLSSRAFVCSTTRYVPVRWWWMQDQNGETRIEIPRYRFARGSTIDVYQAPSTLQASPLEFTLILVWFSCFWIRSVQVVQDLGTMLKVVVETMMSWRGNRMIEGYCGCHPKSFQCGCWTGPHVRIKLFLPRYSISGMSTWVRWVFHLNATPTTNCSRTVRSSPVG
jgi:hypothetical protein